MKKSTLIRWQPHGDPSPYDVLKSAQADTAAGRYDVALAKHAWFHRKAAAYEASPYGLRLNSALANWVKLARLYPPAMAHLLAVRDETTREVRASGRSTEKFVDLEAINRHLGEEERTAKEFLWLDRNRGLIAKRSFDTALPALVKAGEYRICGKYLDARAAMVKRHRLYRYLRQMPEFKEYAEEQFVRQAATIVALLVLNENKPAATALAKLALKHRNTPAMRQHVNKALEGKVPPSP